MNVGFFSPTSWQVQDAPQSFAAECDKCGLFKLCKSPMMPVDGQGKRKILILGEAPGENEDQRSRPFIGRSGIELIHIFHELGVNLRRDCWITNALRCRPMDEHGFNRTPEKAEVAFCRPNLAKTLRELQPEIIIPLGETAVRSLMALAWKDNFVFDTGQWVGWNIPCWKLNAWICPTYHPSFLLRNKDDTEQYGNPVAKLLVSRHLKKAFAHEGRPWSSPPDWEKRALVELNPLRAAWAVRGLMTNARPLAFDFETTTLKPDGPNARILCCSVSDGETSVGFPWTKETREAVGELIRSDIPKIGANFRFEERWCWKEFGHGVKNWQWDTMLGAHWLNCHSSITGLKFQAFVLLGAPNYADKVDIYMEGEGGNGVNRLHEIEMEELCRYCSLDSLFEVLVARKQREEHGHADACRLG